MFISSLLLSKSSNKLLLLLFLCSYFRIFPLIIQQFNNSAHHHHHHHHYDYLHQSYFLISLWLITSSIKLDILVPNSIFYGRLQVFIQNRSHRKRWGWKNMPCSSICSGNYHDSNMIKGFRSFITYREFLDATNQITNLLCHRLFIPDLFIIL